MHSRDWDSYIKRLEFGIFWYHSDCTLYPSASRTRWRRSWWIKFARFESLFMLWNHSKRHEMWRRGDFSRIFSEKVLTGVTWLFGDLGTCWNLWNRLCRLWSQTILRRRVTGVWHPCTLIFQCLFNVLVFKGCWSMIGYVICISDLLRKLWIVALFLFLTYLFLCSKLSFFSKLVSGCGPGQPSHHLCILRGRQTFP